VNEIENKDETRGNVPAQQMSTRSDTGPQTRQLREAGASTSTGKVVLRNANTDPGTETNIDHSNNFKPVNNGTCPGNNLSQDRGTTKPDNSDPDNSHDLGNRLALGRTRSHNSTAGLPRHAKSLKNSPSHTPSASVLDRPEEQVDEPAVVVEAQPTSSHACDSPHTSSADGKGAMRTGHKSCRNAVQARSREDQAASETPEKARGERKEAPKTKKAGAERERLCLQWIRAIEDARVPTNMESDQEPAEGEAPEFCSNKTCPISEHKIMSTPRVLRAAKKVTLRRAVFEGDDERWY